MLFFISCFVFILTVCKAQLGLVSQLITPGQEKCYTESLQKGTVVMFQVKAQEWDAKNDIALPAQDPRFELLVRVHEPSGNVVSTKHYRPENDRVFHTAAETGVHRFCFQAIHSLMNSNNPHLATNFSCEIFLGEEGVVQITSPVELHMHDLFNVVKRGFDIAQKVHAEQAVQRDDELKFQDLSATLNRNTLIWSVVQGLVMTATGLVQMWYLKNFFQARKLV